MPSIEHILSISCDFTEVMGLIRDKPATLHHTSDKALSSEPSRQCQFLLVVVGSRGLLEVNICYSTSAAFSFFFSGELLYCKRRAVIHPFYCAFSASPLIVFYLIESFWSKSTDKNRRPTEKNKLKLFIFQIFLCCTSTILHIFWPPNSISKFI